MKVSTRELALLIRETAKRREESWDCEEVALGRSITRYKLTHSEAAEIVCGESHKDWIDPITIMLTTAWNETLDWAEAQSETV